MALNSLCKNKYVNIQSVIKMKKQEDHMVFPKMAKMI